MRQDVGRATRQHTERHAGTRHSVYDLVNGSVAAADQNQIRPLLHGLTSQLPRAGGARRRDHFQADPLLFQQGCSRVNPRFPSGGISPGHGVIYQNAALEAKGRSLSHSLYGDGGAKRRDDIVKQVSSL